jgi:hypothetical protein
LSRLQWSSGPRVQLVRIFLLKFNFQLKLFYFIDILFLLVDASETL